MADSLIAPVRLGIIKPTSVIAQNITNDPLDVSFLSYKKGLNFAMYQYQHELQVIEKFLNAKVDLSTASTAGDDLAVAKFGRKRKVDLVFPSVLNLSTPKSSNALHEDYFDVYLLCT